MKAKGIKEYPRIKQVGVELEGAWKGDHPVANYNSNQGGIIIRDGSLLRMYTTQSDSPVYETRTGQSLQGSGSDLGEYTLGEVNSNTPIPPITTMGALDEFVLKYYPDWVNDSCGLHVHMSTVHRWAYSKLLSPDFTGDNNMGIKGAIFSAIEKWADYKGFPTTHPIWSRLTGKHEYCRRRFMADGQSNARRKQYGHGHAAERYTAVSYHWNRQIAAGRMRTVEVRLLPMFELPSLALEAIKVVLKTTNDFINEQAAEVEPTYECGIHNLGGKASERFTSYVYLGG